MGEHAVKPGRRDGLARQRVCDRIQRFIPDVSRHPARIIAALLGA